MVLSGADALHESRRGNSAVLHRVLRDLSEPRHAIRVPAQANPKLIMTANSRANRRKSCFKRGHYLVGAFPGRICWVGMEVQRNGHL